VVGFKHKEPEEPSEKALRLAYKAQPEMSDNGSGRLWAGHGQKVQDTGALPSGLLRHLHLHWKELVLK
jgi:hypothetical protein